MAENLEYLALASRITREATAVRDQLLRSARADGASLRTLARASGLSPQGVKLICDRDAQPPGPLPLD